MKKQIAGSDCKKPTQFTNFSVLCKSRIIQLRSLCEKKSKNNEMEQNSHKNWKGA